MSEKLFLTLRALVWLVPVLKVFQSNWMILTSSKDRHDSNTYKYNNSHMYKQKTYTYINGMRLKQLSACTVYNVYHTKKPQRVNKVAYSVCWAYTIHKCCFNKVAWLCFCLMYTFTQLRCEEYICIMCSCWFTYVSHSSTP